MANLYNILNPPLWVDWNIGELLSLGKLYFWDANDHSIPRTVYKDKGATVPWPQPVTLDQYGRSEFPIYGSYDPDDPNDNGYYLEVETSNGTTVYTLDNFLPGITQFPSSSTTTDARNLIRNPQFSIWDHVPVIYTGGTVINTSNVNVNTYEGICDDWYFLKDISDGTDNISRQSFTADQTDVPNNPEFFLRYNCTNAGTSTIKYIAQRFKSAIFLAGQTVSISFWAKADSARTLNLKWQQNFGTGGPTSGVITNPLLTFNLTTSWQRYTTTTAGITIPSASGRTIGTNLNDYSYFIFSLNTGASCTYDFCNIQIETGATVSNFQTESVEIQRSKRDIPWQIFTGKKDDLPINWYQAPTQTLPAYYEGYYAMNDGNIARPGIAGPGIRDLWAYNLYCVLYTNFDNTACPVSGGRTGDPVADWNAGKTLTLPLMQGRTTIGIGAGAGLTARNPGYTNGEENHTLLAAELPPHTHTVDNTVLPTIAQFAAGGVTAFNTGHTTTSSAGPGTSTPFNVMQPSTAWPIYIHI